MPSFNQEHYIREAVDSVFHQDDPDWELWILDNSTDGTPGYLSTLQDPRIHAEHRPQRMDPGTCLNEMLSRARGDQFAFIHTDNRLLPGFVRQHRRVLSRDRLALAYSDFFEIDECGRRVRRHRRPNPYPLERLFSCDSLGVPFAATTALADRIGGFPVGDLADDVFFAVAADGIGPRLHLAEPLVEYRAHGDSRTEQSGKWAVRRAIHRTVVDAYRRRDLALPDPFRGAWPKVDVHLRRASAMARILARHLLARTAAGMEIWIDGTEPASFWLAWACAMEGRPPRGFLDARPGTLLGLPVQASGEGVVLRPRRRGWAADSIGPGNSLPLHWLLRGHPLEARPLRRLPPEQMAAVLVPFQAAHPEGEPVWIRGGGPLAAWLAYGAECLAGLHVAGFIAEERPFPGLEVRSEPCSGACWNLPGKGGPGIPWELRGA